MQHAVDAEPHVAGVAPRLEMDVARALLERVREQPVANDDHVLVVGIELAALAELHELLEVADAAVGALVFFARELDRLCEIEEFDDVVLDVERIGDYALDLEPQDLL